MNKVLTKDNYESILNDLRKKHFKTIATTNGCFDLLHAGHFHLLKTAKEKTDVLVVLLNTNESIKRLKGEDRPILNLGARINQLALLPWVDYILPFEENDPCEYLKTIKPHYHFKDANYDNPPEKKIVETFGMYVPVRPEYLISTSDIISKIQDPLKHKIQKLEDDLEAADYFEFGETL